MRRADPVRLDDAGRRLCDYQGGRCSEHATRTDPEVPFDWMLCEPHYRDMMRRRDENEASWRRALR